MVGVPGIVFVALLVSLLAGSTFPAFSDGTGGLVADAPLETGSAVHYPPKDSLPAKMVITLDGDAVMHTFEGLGALPSYEKLLFDYPEPQRSEVLDYLFLPRYGAALQVLKVEIGYDGNNTAIAWPSYRRSLDEKPDFNRGYVWWLLKEAKKRNPGIKLSALHWGYPAWAKTDEQQAQFIFGFVKGARDIHGLNIDYIGGNSNEQYVNNKQFINTAVTIRLRSLLDRNGFEQVKVVAADEGARVKKYLVVDALVNNPDYAAAVDVIGVHFKQRPSDFMPPQTYYLGKPVWSTEDGGGNYKSADGAHRWVSQIMRLLLDVKMNGIIRWSATASVYDNMPWPSNGFIKAKEPWSGHYVIGPNLWSFSHFTHFISPGWKILDTEKSTVSSGSQRFPGRYVAFKDDDSDHYAIIFNTYDRDFPDEGMDVEIDLSNGLSLKSAGLWRSDFSRESEWFKKVSTFNPAKGKIKLHVDKDRVYTLSTNFGGNVKPTSIPPASTFPFPYSDDFDGYNNSGLARYFVDANGIFAVQEAGGGRNGKALRQMVSESPDMWHGRPLAQPLTEVGNMEWTDYHVEVDVLLENEGSVFLGGRFDGEMVNSGDYLLEGYWLSIDHSGRWKLMRKDPRPPNGGKKQTGDFVVLDSGMVRGVRLNKWMTIGMEFSGTTVRAFLRGKKVTEVVDKTYGNGNVALGVVSADSESFFTPSAYWPNVQYDNFSISPIEGWANP